MKGRRSYDFPRIENLQTRFSPAIACPTFHVNSEININSEEGPIHLAALTERPPASSVGIYCTLWHV